MALSFPLNLSQFWNRLPIREVTWDLPENVEVGMTGGGESPAVELAPQLWRGEVTFGRTTPAEMAEIEVLLDLLRVPGRSFAAIDPRRPAPRLDPRGLVVGSVGIAPTIAALPNVRDMQLTGLPPFFPLSIGDYLSFSYDGGRRALHRVIQPVTTSAAGLTSVFEVVPPVRPGVTVGTAVSLAAPWCVAQIMPRSVRRGASRSGYGDGGGFQFVQTLRR